MRTYIIHLIRHAESEGTSEGRYIGHTDLPLSEEGRARLSQMSSDFRYPDVQAVFSSPLKRCTETAEVLYPGQKPIIIDGLIECNFGEFENKTADDLKNNEIFSGWLAGKVPPPFGESSMDFGKRVCETFEKITEGMMKSGVFETAIITHGGVMATILSAYGLPQFPVHEWIIPNCCGYTLRLDPSMWMRGKKFEIFKSLPEE